MRSAGLPHSAIQGSKRVCRSPWLIAAYRGLHRLRVPRHSPHAFIRLTTKVVKQITRDLQQSDTTVRSARPLRRAPVGPRNCVTVSIRYPTIITTNHCQTARTGARLMARPSDPDDRTRDEECVRRATSVEDFRDPRATTRRSGKEVIQPQVPLRLPCYDFAPVTALAFGRLVP